jgi:membrane protein DedA with SNARE-associated domain
MDGLDPHRLRWFIMLPVCILGVVLGDGILYGIGRLWGPRLLASKWIQRHFVPPDKRAKIEKNFHDRGIMILLTARFTPGIRSPIFLMAGVLRVPLARFLIADGLYAIPGVSALFFLAYFFTDQVMDVFHQLEHYRSFVVVGVLSFFSGMAVHRFAISRHVTTGEPGEVPLINRPMEKVTEAATHAVEKTMEKTAQVVEKTFEAITHRGHTDTPAEPPAEVK